MKKWMYNTLICVFAAVFLISAGMLIWYWVDTKQQQENYDDLAALVQQARPTAPPAGTQAPDSTTPVHLRLRPDQRPTGGSGPTGRGIN